MQYRKFGRTGWKISEIGFGAWAIGGDMWGKQEDSESISALHRAVDNGVNFIDTAQMYGKGHSEELIGKFLKERKEEIYVATKVPLVQGVPWPPPKDMPAEKAFPTSFVIDELEKSLKRLERDYVDLYQFHTWGTRFNESEELFEAIYKLKKAGKIRAAGVSVSEPRPDDIIGSLIEEKIDAIQVIYNLFEQYPEWNLLPVCKKTDTAVIVRVPFDEGALTGKYDENTRFAEEDFRNNYFRGPNLKSVVKKVRELEEFKNKRHPDMAMAEYALRFCLSNPVVSTVIPGIRNIWQADKNTAVSDNNFLEKDELEELKKFAWIKDFWREEIEV